MFYAVEDKSNQLDRLVFLPIDPRLDPGFKGKFIGKVNLCLEPDLGDWPDGADRPKHWFGVSEDGQTYWATRNERKFREDKFTPLDKSYTVGFRSWADYERICVIKDMARNDFPS